MGKLRAATLALLLAAAFLIVGSPPASAFGSEVLGCSANGGWTANTCSTGANITEGSPIFVNFSPSNTSGTYGTSWTIIDDGVAVTRHCLSTHDGPCIYSGCSAGAMNCQVLDVVGADAYVITAYLTLTQSGKSRTLRADATIKAGQPCRTC